MLPSRRIVGIALLTGGACLLAGSALSPLLAQDTPNRREITLVARDFRFSPSRIEVSQDDLVTLTVRSEDVAYGITIDEYRVAKRIPAGGSVTVEFRADRPGTLPFYSNLTSDSRHAEMRGQLVVRPR